MPTFRDWIAGRSAVTIADDDELYVRDDDTDSSKRITWGSAKTALTTAFDAQYAPITGSTVYAPLGAVLAAYAPATTWRATDGAPAISDSALGAAGRRIPGMVFDGSALESASIVMQVPPFSSLDVWLEWANPSATAGDAVWQCSYEFIGPDNTLDALVVGSQITVTSPAQNVVTSTRLISGATRGTAESIMVKIFRRGDVAGDTINAVDLCAIGVRIQEAS